MVPSRKLFGVAFIFLIFTNAVLYFPCKLFIALFRAHERKQGEMLVFIFYCCASLLIVLAAALNIPLVMKVHMHLDPVLRAGHRGPVGLHATSFPRPVQQTNAYVPQKTGTLRDICHNIHR